MRFIASVIGGGIIGDYASKRLLAIVAIRVVDLQAIQGPELAAAAQRDAFDALDVALRVAPVAAERAPDVDVRRAEERPEPVLAGLPRRARRQQHRPQHEHAEVERVRLPTWIIFVPVSACWRLFTTATE